MSENVVGLGCGCVGSGPAHDGLSDALSGIAKALADSKLITVDVANMDAKRIASAIRESIPVPRNDFQIDVSKEAHQAVCKSLADAFNACFDTKINSADPENVCDELIAWCSTMQDTTQSGLLVSVSIIDAAAKNLEGHNDIKDDLKKASKALKNVAKKCKSEAPTYSGQPGSEEFGERFNVVLELLANVADVLADTHTESGKAGSIVDGAGLYQPDIKLRNKQKTGLFGRPGRGKGPGGYDGLGSKNGKGASGGELRPEIADIDEVANIDARVKKSKKEKTDMLRKYAVSISKLLNDLTKGVKKINEEVSDNKVSAEKLFDFKEALDKISSTADIYDRLFELDLVRKKVSVEQQNTKSSLFSDLRKVASVSRRISKDGGFEMVANVMDGIVKTIESYTESLGKKFGTGEISGGAPELGKSTHLQLGRKELKYEIGKLEQFFFVAQTNKNFKDAAKEMDAYSESYDKTLGASFANILEEGSKAHKKKMEAFAKLEDDMFLESNDISRAEEREKIGQFIKNEFIVKDNFYKVVQSIDLYLKNFTKDIALGPQELKEVKQLLDGSQSISNWYDDALPKQFTKIAQAAGGGKSIDELKDDVLLLFKNFTAVSSIMNAFVRIGNKLGGKDLSEKMRISPSNCLVHLMNFLRYSAITIEHDESANTIRAVFNENFQGEFKDEYKYFLLILKSMVAKIMVVIDASEMAINPKASLENIKQLRMVVGGAKGRGDLVYKEAGFDGFTGTSDGAKIYPEAIELYYRLPLLVCYYNDFFRKVASDETADGRRIGMIPEIEGPFSEIVKFVMADNHSDSHDDLTKNDFKLKQLIGTINTVYMHYKDSEGAINIQQIVTDLKNEINRRFGLIRSRDITKYQSLMKKDTRNSFENIGAAELFDQDNLLDTGLDLSDSINRDTTALPSDRFFFNGSTNAELNKTNADMMSSYERLVMLFKNQLDISFDMKGKKNASRAHLFKDVEHKLQMNANRSDKQFTYLAEFIRKSSAGSDTLTSDLLMFHETVIFSMSLMRLLLDALDGEVLRKLEERRIGGPDQIPAGAPLVAMADPPGAGAPATFAMISNIVGPNIVGGLFEQAVQHMIDAGIVNGGLTQAQIDGVWTAAYTAADVGTGLAAADAAVHAVRAHAGGANNYVADARVVITTGMLPDAFTDMGRRINDFPGANVDSYGSKLREYLHNNTNSALTSNYRVKHLLQLHQLLEIRSTSSKVVIDTSNYQSLLETLLADCKYYMAQFRDHDKISKEVLDKYDRGVGNEDIFTITYLENEIGELFAEYNNNGDRSEKFIDERLEWLTVKPRRVDIIHQICYRSAKEFNTLLDAAISASSITGNNKFYGSIFEPFINGPAASVFANMQDKLGLSENDVAKASKFPNVFNNKMFKGLAKSQLGKSYQYKMIDGVSVQLLALLNERINPQFTPSLNGTLATENPYIYQTLSQVPQSQREQYKANFPMIIKRLNAFMDHCDLLREMLQNSDQEKPNHPNPNPTSYKDNLMTVPEKDRAFIAAFDETDRVYENFARGATIDAEVKARFNDAKNIVIRVKKAFKRYMSNTRYNTNASNLVFNLVIGAYIMGGNEILKNLLRNMNFDANTQAERLVIYNRIATLTGSALVLGGDKNAEKIKTEFQKLAPAEFEIKDYTKPTSEELTIESICYTVIEYYRVVGNHENSGFIGINNMFVKSLSQNVFNELANIIDVKYDKIVAISDFNLNIKIKPSGRMYHMINIAMSNGTVANTKAAAGAMIDDKIAGHAYNTAGHAVAALLAAETLIADAMNLAGLYNILPAAALPAADYKAAFNHIVDDIDNNRDVDNNNSALKDFAPGGANVNANYLAAAQFFLNDGNEDREINFNVYAPISQSNFNDGAIEVLSWAGKPEKFADVNEIINRYQTLAHSLEANLASTLESLDDRPKYGETSEDSIIRFTERTGHEPFTLLSNALFLALKKGDEDKIARTSDKEFALKYSMRNAVYRNGKANMDEFPGVKRIVADYNATHAGKFELDTKRFEKFMSNTLLTVRLIGRTGTGLDKYLYENKTVYSVSKESRDIVASFNNTDNTKMMEDMQRIITEQAVNKTDVDRDSLIINNLIELNLMPLNVNALMRSIPMTNLYNYSSLFDQLFYNPNTPNGHANAQTIELLGKEAANINHGDVVVDDISLRRIVVMMSDMRGDLKTVFDDKMKKINENTLMLIPDDRERVQFTKSFNWDLNALPRTYNSTKHPFGLFVRDAMAAFVIKEWMKRSMVLPSMIAQINKEFMMKTPVSNYTKLNIDNAIANVANLTRSGEKGLLAILARYIGSSNLVDVEFDDNKIVHLAPNRAAMLVLANEINIRITAAAAGDIYLDANFRGGAGNLDFSNACTTVEYTVGFTGNRDTLPKRISMFSIDDYKKSVDFNIKRLQPYADQLKGASMVSLSPVGHASYNAAASVANMDTLRNNIKRALFRDVIALIVNKRKGTGGANTQTVTLTDDMLNEIATLTHTSFEFVKDINDATLTDDSVGKLDATMVSKYSLAAGAIGGADIDVVANRALGAAGAVAGRDTTLDNHNNDIKDRFEVLGDPGAVSAILALNIRSMSNDSEMIVINGKQSTNFRNLSYSQFKAKNIPDKSGVDTDYFIVTDPNQTKELVRIYNEFSYAQRAIDILRIFKTVPNNERQQFALSLSAYYGVSYPDVCDYVNYNVARDAFNKVAEF